MKRILTATFAAAAALTLVPSAASAHDGMPDVPGEQFLWLPSEAIVHNPTTDVEFFPEYASSCKYTIRASRSSAVGICYGWSGSGNYKFQVAALIDNCNQRYWYYGNVGYPFVQGKTSTAKWSYVYTPPGGWRIVAAKVVVWKP
jgi:hypothetical protein